MSAALDLGYQTLLVAGSHPGSGLPMLSVRQGLQGAENVTTSFEDTQRRVSRAMRRVPESIPHQVAVETAPDGSWRRAAVSVPRVLFHLQDQAAAQRASAQALGK